jgi:ATP-dependent RNA helicase DeaD
MQFSQMNIRKEVLDALTEMGFIETTKIQEETIPIGLQGKDVLGQAETGSGKTAAFGVPIVNGIEHGHGVQALILAPTRELAEQISKEMAKFSKYRGLEVAAVYGGVDIEPQIRKLKTADIVVATPGRTLDHMERRTIVFSRVRFLVLDEADRMLDMGFIDDIERIIKALPPGRQTMLFSATMPWLFLEMSKTYMKDAVKVSLGKKVDEALLHQEYYEVEQGRKFSLLVHLIRKEDPKLAIVFCNSRFMSDAVASNLMRLGFEAHAIHGGHSQEKRTRIMTGFHEGKVHILVATDVAARGLDIRSVSHVFNYDVPDDPKDYMHRIGRTGRAGDEGRALTLLTRDDHPVFRRIIQNHGVLIERGNPGRYDSMPFFREDTRRVRGRQGPRTKFPKNAQRAGLYKGGRGFRRKD